MGIKDSKVTIYSESDSNLNTLDWLKAAHDVAHERMMSDPDQVRRILLGAQLKLVEHEVKVCCGVAKVLKWELRD